MDKQKDNTTRQHFTAWSGGFPPESDDQISVYIETATPAEGNDEELRELLRAWMNDGDCDNSAT